MKYLKILATALALVATTSTFAQRQNVVSVAVLVPSDVLLNSGVIPLRRMIALYEQPATNNIPSEEFVLVPEEQFVIPRPGFYKIQTYDQVYTILKSYVDPQSPMYRKISSSARMELEQLMEYMPNSAYEFENMYAANILVAKNQVSSFSPDAPAGYEGGFYSVSAVTQLMKFLQAKNEQQY